MKKLILVCLATLLASVYSWGDVNQGEEYTWNNTTKTLTIHKSGDFASGVMTDFSSGGNNSNWGTNAAIATKIIIADGISHIGAYAFEGFSKVTSVTIPSSVTSIGASAFKSCSAIADIHASSPNEWASINFQGNTAQSQPFANSDATNRNFYFYGNSSASSIISLTYGITEVKAYAFYKATNIQGINIPGSVTTIGTKAFAVSSYSSSSPDPWIAINKKVAPTTVATDAFTTGKAIYVPIGNTGYSGAPWTSFTINTQSVSGTCGTPTASDVNWTLSEDGTLTLTGHGSINIGTSGSGMGFARLRRLVTKLVVNNDATGDITDIDHAIHWCYGISEIEINQNTIPVSELIATESSTGYAYLFNKRDNVVLKIKAASLADASVSNLASDPWNNAKLDITLSDAVTIADNADNTTLLTNCSTYVEKPFNMNLTRSMSNEYYNTFCSPINMDAALVTSTFGADTKIYSFAGTSYDEGMDELSLNFNESQDYITAGVPYLIWPGNNVSNPSFTDVNPSNVATAEGTVAGTHATFYGALAPVVIPEGGNKNFIFLQANNTLNWASEGTLGGMRAYWLLTTDVPARAMARRPVINIGNDAMGIGQVQRDKVPNTKVLKDGQLYLMYEGRMYDVRGMRVD